MSAFIALYLCVRTVKEKNSSQASTPLWKPNCVYPAVTFLIYSGVDYSQEGIVINVELS